MAKIEEDYPGCDPNDPIWDDGFGSPVDGACENEWEETVGRQLDPVPAQGPARNPGDRRRQPQLLPLRSTSSDNPVGNDHVADGTAEDYDLDGFSDDDLDGDNTNDWILYVNSVEERNSRTCAPAASLPTWTPTLTPTPTFTLTPTLTPTPTPIVDCARITVTDLIAYSSYDWKATFTNGLSSEIVIQQMDFIWIPKDSTHYVDYISFRYMNSYSSSYLLYTGNDYTSPTSVTIPWATNSTLEAAADLAANSSAPWYLNMSSDTRQDGYHQLCVDFIVYNLPTSGANLVVCRYLCRGLGKSQHPDPDADRDEHSLPDRAADQYEDQYAARRADQHADVGRIDTDQHADVVCHTNQYADAVPDQHTGAADRYPDGDQDRDADHLIGQENSHAAFQTHSRIE